MPALVGLLHIDLHEGAGILDGLPRRGLLAGAQPDDDIADPHCLAGLERHVARNAVTLVEQPEHRDTLVHRRRRGRQCAAVGRRGGYGRGRLAGIIGVARGDDRVDALIIAAAAAIVACGEAREQRRRRGESRGAAHASGVQAS